MKIKTLAVAAGISAPLILGGSASGGFVGVECCAKTNPLGLVTINVYAVFDRPGEDLMLAVAATPNNPLFIELLNGTFYQHLLGTDLAPLGAAVVPNPSLAFDTFVTIGVKIDGAPGQPQNSTILQPGWPGFFLSQLSLTSGGWSVTPDQPQADPFNPLYFAGDGRVLIGQFSTFGGGGILGTIVLQYQSNGVITQSVEHLNCGGGAVGCPTICQSDADCDDGDPCNGIEICVDGICQPISPVADCNGNGVLDSCDIAGGTPDCNGNGVPDECDIAGNTSQDINSNGVPDECEYIGDLDNDGTVGIVDFLALLANWGPCPP